MSRFPASGVLAALLLAALGCGGEPPPRPHVLLIVVDTLRADHLGFHGYARDTSPRLDALAAESIVFRRALTPAPWTNPAVAALLTGQPPGALGIGHAPARLPDDLPSLAPLLAARGYQTAGIVSNTLIGRRYGFDRGFGLWDQSQWEDHHTISSPELTRRAVAWLEARDPDAPFFLLVHYFDPHFQYHRHPEHAFGEAYDGPLARMTESMKRMRRFAAGGRYTARDRQFLLDLYDSEIAFTDVQVGRLLDALRELDLYDDALIVFTADHGEAFAERADRWIGHTRFLYQEQLHVPLTLKLPGRATPRSVDAVVSTADVFPTVLELAGVPLPPGLPAGRRSLLAGSAPPAVFAETRRLNTLQTVVAGGWKLIRNPETGRAALFDLAADPGERVDLAAREPARVARLTAALRAWSRATERRRSGPAAVPALSEAERERLRALGYVDELSPEALD